jgi:hypothetical protein
MALRTELLVLSDFAYPTGLEVYLLYRVFHKSGIIGILKNDCSLNSVKITALAFQAILSDKNDCAFPLVLVMNMLSKLYNSCVETPIFPAVPALWNKRSWPDRGTVPAYIRRD